MHTHGYMCVYYPPEVRRGEYWGLDIFLLQYFPLVKILHYNCINMFGRGISYACNPTCLCNYTGLGQYVSLGEYCGPHTAATASSTFLILVYTQNRYYMQRINNQRSFVWASIRSDYLYTCMYKKTTALRLT